MSLEQNVSLASHSTMGLGGPASYLTTVATSAEAYEALRWARDHAQPIIMIGAGSNIVWKDEGFNGLVVVNRILGFEIFSRDDLGAYVKVGAGENWDSVVERTVQAGLSGIEALSLIPGTTGATPVQNVGAYGQDVSETIATIEAYDTHTGNLVTLAGSDCNFAYRTSRFNREDRGRFFILNVTFHLFTAPPFPPFYPAVQTYLSEHGIHTYSPAAIREAVIAIRSAKLPDPAVVKNNGSFFGNPILSKEDWLEKNDSLMQSPHWSQDDGSVKISAAWLIEQVGYKGVDDVETGMATWPAQPLVLVNKTAKTTADLLAFKQKIVDAVQQRFGITLVQEPELLPR